MPLENINNSYVPDSALIEPPQALVDTVIQQMAAGNLAGILRFDAVGMTHFASGDYLTGLLDGVFAKNASLTINFSNNALDQSSVNLAISTTWNWANNGHTGYSGGHIIIDGGANVAPDGDVTSLISDLTGWGWTVTTN